jgi:curved DNA-binding protein CbpA
MKRPRDYYERLGLSRVASQEDIRKAYRKLVREHHPDTNPGDHSAEERFKDIQQAYEVLSNPEQRRGYDQRLRASAARSPGGPRAGAGVRTGGVTATTTVDLSDLLRRLADRSDRPQESSRHLRDEDVARLIARVLGGHVSRTSGRLGKDVTRLSKLLGENIKMSAKVSVGDARAEGASATGEAPASRKRPGPGSRSQRGSNKVARTQRKDRRVQGPKARRRRTGD